MQEFKCLPVESSGSRWFLMREAFLEKLELPSLGPTDQEMKTGPSIFLGLSLCPDRTSGKGSRRAALWAWRGRQRDWGPHCW